MAIYAKDELINSLSGIIGQIREAVKTLDLTETCLLFSFPVYGEFTRLELINFVICHTQRHIHQLKKIYNELNSKNESHFPKMNLD